MRSTPISTASRTCSTSCAAARPTSRCRGSRRSREAAGGAGDVADAGAPVPTAPCTGRRTPAVVAAPRDAAPRPQPRRAPASRRRRAHGRAPKPKPGRDARCCACAPTSIDRLVNEAGEVAIARARIEGELRALKANLLELTGSVIRLRSAGARDRDPGRVADPVAHDADAGAAGRLRSARVRPLHALPGADALARRRRQRRLDRPAVAAEEPRRRRRRAARAGAAVARSAAAAVRDPHGAVRQPVRAPVPDHALDREGARQARQPRDPRRRRPSSTARCWRSSSARSSTCCATRSTMASRRATRARAAGKPETGRDHADRAPGRQRNRDRARRRRRAASTSTRIREKAQRARPARGRRRSRPTRSSLECIFQPGFSTASKVTQISGRGVGMDVVRAEIAALGGRVDVATDAGRGHDASRCTLPLTLAVAQAVLVRAGGRLWALPAPMVEQVQQVKRAGAARPLRRSARSSGRASRYPFHYLPRLLGDTDAQPGDASATTRCCCCRPARARPRSTSTR